MSPILIISIVVCGILTVLFAASVITTIVRSIQESAREADRDSPWKMLCDSIEGGFEKWNYKDRTKELGGSSAYKIWWQLRQEDTGIAIGVLWGSTKEYDKNKVYFFNDSKIKFVLSWGQQKVLYKAINKSMARMLKKKITPERVNYKDGYFFCPYCGERVEAQVIEENKEGPCPS